MLGESAARDPRTRPAKLARLARSRHPDVRRFIAENPSTPSGALGQLADDPDDHVVLAVAQSSNVPASALERLSNHADVAVRESVGRNPATSAAALHAIANAKGATEREQAAVAANPSAAAETLYGLRHPRNGFARDVPKSILVALASNPSSSEDALRHLFGRDESTPAQRDINAALAGNPSTPIDTRARLFAIEAYRDAVVASEPPRATKHRLTLARSASGEVAQLLAKSPAAEVRRTVVLSRGADDTIFAELACDPVREVALVARARTSTDGGLLEKYASSSDGMVLEALIRNPTLAPAKRAEVARASLPSASETTLGIIADDPHSPSDVLAQLVQRALATNQHMSDRLKRAVILNPNTDADTHRTLAEGANAKLRSLAVKSPSAPLDLLVGLAADADPTVRRAVAASSSVPPDLLVRLAADADPTVRTAVATNALTPAEALYQLATDQAADVVAAVARHPNATPSILDRVVVDQLERHRPSAQLNHEQPDLLQPLEAAAANEVTSHECLRAIADSVDRANASLPTHGRDKSPIGVGIWFGIARNRAAPSDLLDQVARTVHMRVWTRTEPAAGGNRLEDDREAILQGIVNNPSTPINTLKFLSTGDWVARKTTRTSERDDGHTTYWTVWNYKATEAARTSMAHKVRREISRRQWTDVSEPKNRLAFASDPDADPEILHELSSDSNANIRQAVAGNPSTARETFKNLAADKSVEVRMASAGANHQDTTGFEQGTYTYSEFSREASYGTAFEQLASDHDPAVRAELVRNHAVFWGILSQNSRDLLVLDENHRVRAAVVAAMSYGDEPWDDFGISEDALAHLVDTSGPEAWRAIANRGRTALSIEVLRLLATTRDTETLVRVADAENVDQQLLVLLANSDDAAVVEAIAEEHPFVNDDRFIDEALVLTLVRNPLTPASYLETAASKSFFERRLEKVTNERLKNAEPSGLMSPLSYIDSFDKHSAEARKELEDNDKILHLALAHPNFPDEALSEYGESVDVHRLRAAARSGKARALVAVASNPSTPTELLEELAEIKDPEVRRALLENESTPPELLVRLIQSRSGAD